jgi:hypothetical protein
MAAIGLGWTGLERSDRRRGSESPPPPSPVARRKGAAGVANSVTRPAGARGVQGQIRTGLAIGGGGRARGRLLDRGAA